MDKITAMSIRYVILLATAALVSGGLLFLPAASKTDGAPTPPPSEIKRFVASRCAGCHQGKTPAAGLDLTSIGFALDHAQTLSWWVRVHDAVRDGRMPPPAAGSVAPADSQKFLTSLSTHLTAHARQRAAAQGRSVLRRLNRYEYESTVRDLLSAPWLQLKDSLPEDGVVHRFNKSGEGLDVSHVQMARYLEAAEQALRDALAAAKVPSHSERQYAREQKPLIRRMSFGPFNNHPERATIPILGFDAQPEVMALKAPMTVGSADPATREREGFATPASTYIGNEMHFDGFTAPVGGAYRVRFNAFSLWVHTKYVTAPWRQGEIVAADTRKDLAGKDDGAGDALCDQHRAGEAATGLLRCDARTGHARNGGEPAGGRVDHAGCVAAVPVAAGIHFESGRDG